MRRESKRKLLGQRLRGYLAQLEVVGRDGVARLVANASGVDLNDK